MHIDHKKRIAADHVMGMSIRALARRYGHSPTSIFRWLHEPDIEEYASQLRAKQLAAVERAVTELPAIAVVALAQVASDGGERGADRVKAAEAILTLSGLKQEAGPAVEVHATGDVTLTPALERLLDGDE